jgi:hypothetical protein
MRRRPSWYWMKNGSPDPVPLAGEKSESMGESD